MSVGQRIKQRRKELGISADDLGKLLGKDRSTVFRYEKGDIEKLPVDILQPIAAALHTTPEYLMGWEKVQKNNDILADIVIRMRRDDLFFELVKKLNDLDDDKLSSILNLLK